MSMPLEVFALVNYIPDTSEMYAAKIMCSKTDQNAFPSRHKITLALLKLVQNFETVCVTGDYVGDAVTGRVYFT
jgi:hypothetical protein